MRAKELKGWTMALSQLFAIPNGRPRLRGLCQWLESLCPVDHFVLFAYEGDHRPLALFDTFSPERRAIYVDDYQAGPYLLDPIYLACTRGQAPGLYRLRQLAPDHFYLGEYFLNYYQRTGLTEEIAFFIALPDGATAVLSLMRRQSSPAFSRDELQWLDAAAPAVEQVVFEAWQQQRSRQPRPASDRDQPLRAAFEEFGAGVLTPREQEIARLLLRGHSSASVAEQLGISPGTVKIHRKNLYARLSIGSQAELLGLFVQELAGRAGTTGLPDLQQARA